MQTEKRVVVVTGGGSGIGQATAVAFALRGAHTAICGRNEDRLRASQRLIASKGGSVHWFPCDITVQEQVNEFLKAVHEHFGGIHVLVNNAALSRMNPIQDDSHDVWRRTIGVNLDGMYYCTSGVLRYMPDGGSIINLSSLLGKVGAAGYSAYCTSKHGIIGFTRALALELAPRNITVNAVCPGWVDTGMAQRDMQSEAEKEHRTYEEYRKQVIDGIPLKRIVQAEEVAELVCFLASPAAASITGEAVNINGGELMD